MSDTLRKRAGIFIASRRRILRGLFSITIGIEARSIYSGAQYRAQYPLGSNSPMNNYYSSALNGSDESSIGTSSQNEGKLYSGALCKPHARGCDDSWIGVLSVEWYHRRHCSPTNQPAEIASERMARVMAMAHVHINVASQCRMSQWLQKIKLRQRAGEMVTCTMRRQRRQCCGVNSLMLYFPFPFVLVDSSWLPLRDGRKGRSIDPSIGCLTASLGSGLGSATLQLAKRVCLQLAPSSTVRYGTAQQQLGRWDGDVGRKTQRRSGQMNVFSILCARCTGAPMDSIY